jgi:hypothetical protein
VLQLPDDARRRQLSDEFINSGRRKLVSICKVEFLEVPEILEPVDAGQLGAVGKVEFLEVPEILEPVDAGQLGAVEKVELGGS